jgi:ribonuclease E
MSTRMLIDAAHPEETRVVVLNGNKLEEFDVEVASRRQLKGNIYLAKVVRVEPSLQAAFVDYGGNRHGFLSFNEIHPDYYQIPVADREALVAEHEAQHRRDDERQDNSQASSREVAEEPAQEAAPESADESETPIESSELAPESSDIAAETSEQDESASEASESPLEAAVDSTSAEPSGEVVVEAPTASIETVAAAPATVETLGGDDREEVEVRRPHHSHRHYRIQEVIKRRQILLVQVVKEERGNKGAALTTYLSLAGRYCVLMPNTARGGGVSRKITSGKDRDRLKKVLSDLDIPDGMGVIVRTAGADKTKSEIKRDCTYLLKLWDSVRDLTLKSVAPCLVYEEASLIKRTIRDVYSSAIDEILIQGDEAFRSAKDLMKLLIPSHAKRVQAYEDTTVPLFQRFKVEQQIDATHNPVVQLPSGGYIVINPTEALVSIDVNSGRSTRERNIEETALKTNMEAAAEVARQLRLRDLAGLIVIDFIDMESSRNNTKVERQLKDAMRSDRARIQLGKISPFGLLELSRQRLRPSLFETSFEPCPHCGGSGILRSLESAALHVLRALEEEGVKLRNGDITLHVPTKIALYILNQQRGALGAIEKRYEFSVMVSADDSLIPPNFKLEHRKGTPAPAIAPMAQPVREIAEDDIPDEEEEIEADETAEAGESRDEGEGSRAAQDEGDGQQRRRRRRRRRGRGDRGDRGDQQNQQRQPQQHSRQEAVGEETHAGEAMPALEGDAQEQGPRPDRPGEEGRDGQPRRRRRGRRGGRRRGRRNEDGHTHQEGQGPMPAGAEGSSEPQPWSPSEEPYHSTTESHHAEPSPAYAEPSRPEPAAALTQERPEQTVQAPSAPVSQPASDEPPAKPKRGWWERWSG